MANKGFLSKIMKNNTSETKPPAKWGLVLSGGGTKGAYEVGVWKAINELKIPIDGISGTSIGAINAALFIGSDQKTIEDLYRNIQIDDILPVGEEVDAQKNIFDPANLLAIAKEYIAQRGMDNAPLRNMMVQYVDVDKIYESPLDLGIVTYDIKSRSAVEVFKDDIPQDKLIEYLLASANFPIFKAQQVDGMQFMDGGLYDNMPFNILIERGYTHLIIVDVNGVGMTRRMENGENVYIKMIACSEDLGGTFEFNQKQIERNMLLGYLDTLKEFHKLFGNYYFFRRPAFNELMQCFDLETIDGLETAARLYGLKRLRIYSANEFLDHLEALHDQEARTLTGRESDIISRSDLGTARNMLRTGKGIAAYASKLAEQPNFKNNLITKTFPEEVKAATAINELKNFRRL